MKKHCINSSKKGFTIIELFTVMSIIFILMGLIIPKLNGYRGKAEKLKIENYARQIYIAAMASYGENNGKFIADAIKNDINDLTSITVKEGVNTKVVAANDSATVTFTVEGVTYDVVIDNNGYSYKEQ